MTPEQLAQDHVFSFGASTDLFRTPAEDMNKASSTPTESILLSKRLTDPKETIKIFILVFGPRRRRWRVERPAPQALLSDSSNWKRRSAMANEANSITQ